MKYLLLLCGQPQDREAWETLPDETRAQHYSRVGQWFGEHRSQIRSSNQFTPITWSPQSCDIYAHFIANMTGSDGKRREEEVPQ